MHPRRSAFTLLELLVSMALIAVIITVASTTFFQMLTMAKRLQALQTMDAAAKTTYEKLAGEVTVIHPCAALWLRSKASTKDVEFVFMRSKFNRLDYVDTKFPWDVGSDLGYTDLVWSRWHWNASTETLKVSTSRTCRWTSVRNDQARDFWKISGGSKMGDTISTFVSIPQLRRETGTALNPNDPEKLLDLNSWDTNEATDIGDYSDLKLNAVPMLYNCTALSIELKNLDGSTRTADGSADLAWAAPGTYVDGQDHANLADRPSLVRLRFTLTAQTNSTLRFDRDDVSANTSRVYSFSFTAPSFTHY